MSAHSQAELAEARGWIADCSWADDVARLTDAQVIAGIGRHYEGGWAAFRADGAIPIGPPERAWSNEPR